MKSHYSLRLEQTWMTQNLSASMNTTVARLKTGRHDSDLYIVSLPVAEKMVKIFFNFFYPKSWRSRNRKSIFSVYDNDNGEFSRFPYKETFSITFIWNL